MLEAPIKVILVDFEVDIVTQGVLVKYFPQRGRITTLAEDRFKRVQANSRPNSTATQTA